jgi:hypothetical protein
MNVDTISLSLQLWNNAVLRESVVSAAEIYVKNNNEQVNTEVYAPADSLLMESLWRDTTIEKEEMQKILDSIEQNGKTTRQDLDEQLATIRNTYNQFGMLNLPIGWVEENEEVAEAHTYHHVRMHIIETEHSGFKAWWLRNTERIRYYFEVIWIYAGTITILKLLGWLFTAIAISFGAPLWFDLLNKLINIRGNVRSDKKIVITQQSPAQGSNKN